MVDEPELRTRRFTVDQVLRMVDVGILADDDRLQLLDGQLLVMPSHTPRSASLASMLRGELSDVYRSGYVVRGACPLVAGADSLPEPDVAVVRGAYRDFATRHPRGDEALLVVELARTSASVDRKKAAAYARAGVAVYWLVDLVSRRVAVHTDPRPDGRYALGRVAAAGEELELPATGTRWPVALLLQS